MTLSGMKDAILGTQYVMRPPREQRLLIPFWTSSILNKSILSRFSTLSKKLSLLKYSLALSREGRIPFWDHSRQVVFQRVCLYYTDESSVLVLNRSYHNFQTFQQVQIQLMKCEDYLLKIVL